MASPRKRKASEMAAPRSAFAIARERRQHLERDDSRLHLPALEAHSQEKIALGSTSRTSNPGETIETSFLESPAWPLDADSASVEMSRATAYKELADRALQSEVTRNPDGDIAARLRTIQEAQDLTEEASYELRETSKDERLLEWRATRSNFQRDGEGFEIRMVEGETTSRLGQYGLQIRQGIVQIYGAGLGKSETVYPIYAPATHAIPSITCKSSQATIYITRRIPKLLELYKLSSLFAGILDERESIQDRTRSNEPARALNDVSYAHDSPSLLWLTPNHKSNVPWDDLKPSVNSLSIDPAWSSAINTACSKEHGRIPRILICGSKSTGKSTIARLIANRLITQPVNSGRSQRSSFQTTFLLDLDPGQPEFSPPGQISLIKLQYPILGPPFTHPTTDNRAKYTLVRGHAFAGLSPIDDYDAFLWGAQQLIDQYEACLEEYPGAALVINCAGWPLNRDLEEPTELLQDVNLLDVIFMETPDSTSIRSTLQNVAGSFNLHILRSKTYLSETRSPKELRDMQTMSYFHTSGVEDGTLEWQASPLAHTNKITVRYDDANAGILGFMLLSETVAPEQLAMVLHRSVVAIVCIEDPALLASSIPIRRSSPDNMPYVMAGEQGYVEALDPSKSSCLGQALIWAIDTKSQHLQIVTPVPVETFQKGRNIVLVRGGWGIADWAYLEEITAARANGAPEEVVEEMVKNSPYGKLA
ncbi:MAG: Polynucleotide 5'-hydroxyl-kinase grc3 [Bogoriella megaspora]|nr:MAG: Polynucleotide 5'-hydroxyl-kinase grc3 [Bogoriella megaspora]